MQLTGEWNPEHTLTAVALAGAFGAFVTGLLQYRKAQRWKRAEWVAQEMKQLFGDPVVQAVLLMIDWGKRQIPLYPHREDDSARSVLLGDDDIARALMLHDDRPEGFTDLEADIRGAFDRLLDGWERFQSYVEAGLVTDSDLTPYLRYWAEQICREALPGSEDRLIQLRRYMDRYGFGGAHKLLTRIAAP